MRALFVLALVPLVAAEGCGAVRVRTTSVARARTAEPVSTRTTMACAPIGDAIKVAVGREQVVRETEVERTTVKWYRGAPDGAGGVVLDILLKSFLPGVSWIVFPVTTYDEMDKNYPGAWEYVLGPLGFVGNMTLPGCVGAYMKFDTTGEPSRVETIDNPLGTRTRTLSTPATAAVVRVATSTRAATATTDAGGIASLPLAPFAKAALAAGDEEVVLAVECGDARSTVRIGLETAIALAPDLDWAAVAKTAQARGSARLFREALGRLGYHASPLVRTVELSWQPAPDERRQGVSVIARGRIASVVPIGAKGPLGADFVLARDVPVVLAGDALVASPDTALVASGVGSFAVDEQARALVVRGQALGILESVGKEPTSVLDFPEEGYRVVANGSDVDAFRPGARPGAVYAVSVTRGDWKKVLEVPDDVHATTRAGRTLIVSAGPDVLALTPGEPLGMLYTDSAGKPITALAWDHVTGTLFGSDGVDVFAIVKGAKVMILRGAGGPIHVVSENDGPVLQVLDVQRRLVVRVAGLAWLGARLR